MKALPGEYNAAALQAPQPRGRVRPPRQFAAFADPGGELVSLQRWRVAITRLQDGRYADEHVRPFSYPIYGESVTYKHSASLCFCQQCASLSCSQ